MTDRDRLIELFDEIEKDPAITCPHYKTDKTCDTCKYTINNYLCNHTERTIDYLLANGVIVPPCKVGDYVRFKGLTSLWRVDSIHYYREGLPQISVTNGKVTSTITDFETFEVVSKEEAE